MGILWLVLKLIPSVYFLTSLLYCDQACPVSEGTGAKASEKFAARASCFARVKLRPGIETTRTLLNERVF